MRIDFNDHSAEFQAAMQEAACRALTRCGLQAEGYAKDLAAPVDTGNLENSITHKVDPDKLVTYIGTNSEYAAYVELGTGKFYPGGRQTPWVYQDAKGNWHRTHGKKARPFLKPAVADHQATYRNIAVDAAGDKLAGKEEEQ